jgi:hypothetical protein
MMRWSNGAGPCASYGTDCVEVEDNFSEWCQGYIRTVTYRDGRVHTIKPTGQDMPNCGSPP